MAQNNSRGFSLLGPLAIVAFFLVIGVIIVAIAIPGIIKQYYTFDKVLGGETSTTANTAASSASGLQELQYPSDLDPTAIANCLSSYINNIAPTSYLKNKGQVFADSGKQYNVNPALMLAIGQQESTLGINGNVALAGGYNYYGFTDSSDSSGWKRFSTAEEAINRQAKYLAEGYLYYANDQKTTISAIGSVYCPVGATNDPNNLNKNWVPGVTKNFNAIIAACPQLQKK
jgi:hypothetical protein